MNETICNKLIKLSKKAAKHKEVPVAAIITRKNKIIACTYNKRESKKDALGHAEILCIKKASKKIKSWKLDGCIMYCTLKPCSMCEKIIRESRIDEVIYILEKNENKKEYDKTKIKKYDNKKYEIKLKTIMKNFFVSKR